MAVDLVGLPRMEEQMAIQEAASAGLKSMEHLIHLLNSSQSNNPDYSHLTDFTVSKFKQLINLLNRTGHARFRRAPNSNHPSPSPSLNPPQLHPSHSPGLTLDFAKPTKVKPTNTTTPLINHSTDLSVSHYSKDTFTTSTISPPISTTTASSFMSSITGDGSVSDGKIGPSLLAPPPPAPSAAKPPLSSSHRKRCHDAAFSEKLSSSSAHCHCSKRRFHILQAQARSYANITENSLGYEIKLMMNSIEHYVISSYFRIADWPSCPCAEIRTPGVAPHLPFQIRTTLQEVLPETLPELSLS
ncbi:putative WRKY transcription factor 17 [Senna tora]|uniref:Putative WRKY transcription factor 17 n=1 Tax=Senna tora TaxID=362788 RepID=A0A835CE04_9FABA|nr:putative WRKY transcription factor 17 [Senna tora]